LDQATQQAAARFSFGRFTTIEEILQAVAALQRGVEFLRNKKI
jgi:cysteine sulfinate desulfinase/cysteine desulfurase-like protein